MVVGFLGELGLAERTVSHLSRFNQFVFMVSPLHQFISGFQVIMCVHIIHVYMHVYMAVILQQGGGSVIS